VNPSPDQTGTISDLCETSREGLFRYALRLCGTVDRADDLVQETFLRALQHSTTLLRMNPFQRDAWLKRVLRNRFFDEQRAAKRANALLVEAIREARRPVTAPAAADLGDILDRIPDRFREVVERRFRLGMTSREISQELGIPAATVRSHLRQAILWLRREMSDAIR
jgi:RNA polymerase sigma-70 factor (ECF subfamily)